MSDPSQQSHIITMNQISRILGNLEGKVEDIQSDIEVMKGDIKKGHVCIQADNIFNLKELVVANKKLIDAAEKQATVITAQLDKVSGGVTAGGLFVKLAAWVTATALAVTGLIFMIRQKTVIYNIDPEKVIEIMQNDGTSDSGSQDIDMKEAGND